MSKDLGSLKNAVKATPKELSDWRNGYDTGYQAAVREHRVAFQLGRAILDAIDDRYEFKKEEY